MPYFSTDAPELKISVKDNELFITHNAGFFSCCSIAFFNIVSYFNTYKKLPINVNRNGQFSYYKINSYDNLIPLLFNESDTTELEFTNAVDIISPDDSPQFSDYRNLNFSEIKFFIDKYFKPSDLVSKIINQFEEKYKLDYKNICSVFYRGNDKITETRLGSYDEYFEKCSEILKENPEINFLVQTDETEFLSEFKSRFSSTIYFEELPHMTKRNSAMQYELQREELPIFAVYFLAATICVSKCEHVVTHSGNCGLWAVLYRGNCKNLHQYLSDKWV